MIYSSSDRMNNDAALEPKITVRIIGRCNFSCPHCSSFSDPGRRGQMSGESFRRAVGILAAEDFRGQLNISGGETTLHPDLAEFVSCASAGLPGARIAVFTNGDWVGRPGWRDDLRWLLGKPNVCVRFSIDRQHAEGKARALAAGGRVSQAAIRGIEEERLAKAADFLAACRNERAEPGVHFDFAFKGTREEALRYLSPLGSVPVYPIRFRKNPAKRPKTMGFLAVDLDGDGRPWVYLTLAHIAEHDPLGGLEALASALNEHRRAIRVFPHQDSAP